MSRSISITRVAVLSFSFFGLLGPVTVGAQPPAGRQPDESQAGNGPRDDLERFVGLYGDPADESRTLFALVSCDGGRLVVGPTWADVGPWWMSSPGDTAFSYSDSFQSISIEFETDESGQAQRLVHDIDGLTSPLDRLGPIPDGWPACAEPPLR